MSTSHSTERFIPIAPVRSSSSDLSLACGLCIGGLNPRVLSSTVSIRRRIGGALPRVSTGVPQGGHSSWQRAWMSSWNGTVSSNRESSWDTGHSYTRKAPLMCQSPWHGHHRVSWGVAGTLM